MNDEPIIVHKQHVENFARKAFDYLNGKINIFNYPATLEIEWAELLNRSTAAITRNPNIVILYPHIIMRHVECEYDLYFNI